MNEVYELRVALWSESLERGLIGCRFDEAACESSERTKTGSETRHPESGIDARLFC